METTAVKTAASPEDTSLPALCGPVVELSPLPMIAVEGPGHIIRYVNPAFCRLIGRSREELTGKTFSRAVSPTEQCLPVLDRLYQTGQPQIHIGLDDDDVKGFCWSYAMWPVRDGAARIAGSIIHVMETSSFHRQVTLMNQALLIGSVRQHELTEQAQVLSELLGRANEDLKQFAFAASHDLQEPLRMITSYSQLLVESLHCELDAEAQLCVDFISQGAKQMRSLLANLLAYTEAGAASWAANEVIDLNTILEQVKENLKIAIAGSGAEVTAGTLPSVPGHAGRLVHLFQNLIGNAIKYRGTAPPRIHVSVELDDTEWRFAVADNGMGVAPEYYLSIFGVFTRLHGSAIPGTGMGLAICKRVVERSGGRIWVESTPGQGTTFYFTLPKNAKDS
ncbi:MAG: ATP-binding protein [Acidobacteriota bacterium]|nr:ATP-binding protein [Acidobacteriota bacterium]